MTKVLHILLVEDMDFIQQVTKNMLAKLGHTCDIAENGVVALALLEKANYDVVLMDINMPVMDGLVATRQARAKGMNLPIIGISGDVESTDQRACFDAGMNGFLKKPPSLALLKAEFDRILG